MLNTERLCIGCMNDNGGEKVCSICGYDSSVQNAPEYLPTHYWLKDRYLIGKVIDFNSEGVTYIGWDNIEDQIVNVREYFPLSAAKRDSDKKVAIKSGEEFVFNEGIMNFLELHRTLASLSDLPALLPVTEVFEDNGTAYSICKSVAGITLREFLIRNGGNLSWEQARPLFLPLITTVQGLHDAGVIHRGISPETVVVGRDGKLRLTGICIRSVRMAKSSMSMQLFPGFSATEQYGFDLELVDGKYTDVYGMAATLFRVLMGAAPTDAAERISNDNLQIPARFIESLPKYVLSTLANGLQIMPANRTPDMESFRMGLTPVVSDATVTFNAPPKKVEPAPVAAKPKKEESPKKEKNNSGKKYAIISSAITAAVFIVLAVIFFILTGNPNEGGGYNKPAGNETGSGIVVPDNNKEDKPVVKQPEDGEKLHQVPNLIGKPYAEIVENIEYTILFEFEVKDKQFSDTYPKGYVIAQTPTSDQSVKKETKIELTLSLGPRMVSLANVTGMNKDQAILELMKQGFLFENIRTEVVYEETAKNQKYEVLGTEIPAGTKLDTDSAVTIYINAYYGNDSTQGGNTEGGEGSGNNNGDAQN